MAATNGGKPDEIIHQLKREQIEAFEYWYESDRDFDKTSKHFRVHPQTIRNWAEWWDWRTEADRRDAEVQRRLAKVSVMRKAQMVERHRLAGQLMVHRGTQYFRNNDSTETPITRTADAINAIAKGVEVEAKAEGLPPWIFELLGADDETLAAMVRQAASEQSPDASNRAPFSIGAGSGESDADVDDAADQPENGRADAPTA